MTSVPGRRLAFAVLTAFTLLAGCTGAPPMEAQEATPDDTQAAGPSEDEGEEVIVRQAPGNVVYWLLPGERRLSEHVFGTPAHPVNTGQHEMQVAEGSERKLLQEVPLLVGVPVEKRATGPQNDTYTATKMPTPVSDNGRIVSGAFDVTYRDRQPYDLPGDPFDTADDVQLNATFTDPAGNDYEMRVKQVFQYPIPLYQTGGGVVTDAWIHGLTETESPLFPTTYVYGAFWGIGDLVVNGEVTDENKVMHLMTTQIVRDSDYRLAVDEELPLPPEDTFAGQLHHTHAIVRPLEWTEDGLRFDPVNTSFTLPNGKTQPFVHVMFEQDEIVQGPFKNWTWPRERADAADRNATTQAAEGARVVEVEGYDFAFEPANLRVEAGETVTVVFRNAGTVAHNFGIGAFDVRTESILPGERDAVTFTANQTGTYAFWCDVPGHRHAGMEGEVHVARG